MEKTRLIFIGSIIVVISTVIVALWYLTGELPANAVRVWAVAVTLAAVALFAAGFWFGKVEARGVLHGFDKSLDRVANIIGDVATTRDQSRINVHNATKAPTTPGYTVVLPGVKDLPPITHRAIDDGRQMIEL